MSFFFLMSLAAALAWALSHLFKRPMGQLSAMRWGMGLGFLFTGVDHFVNAANVNVALKGQSVQGLDFGAWYYWIRPLFQPVFIAWALYCAGVWPRSGRATKA